MKIYCRRPCVVALRQAYNPFDLYFHSCECVRACVCECLVSLNRRLLLTLKQRVRQSIRPAGFAVITDDISIESICNVCGRHSAPYSITLGINPRAQIVSVCMHTCNPHTHSHTTHAEVLSADRFEHAARTFNEYDYLPAVYKSVSPCLGLTTWATSSPKLFCQHKYVFILVLIIVINIRLRIITTEYFYFVAL